ncbi:PEP-CTERM sorting domain-containing protein [Pseudaeromonas sharmana]|uniref:PEP-CTERM sorting domain-containing protein n=1 Tax=Pseudaeromonas sharmana TaxID=328412 RepID=A0ABV8CMU8_9GAMM
MKYSTTLLRKKMLMLLLLSLSSVCHAQTYDGVALNGHGSTIASLIQGSPATTLPATLAEPTHFSPSLSLLGFSDLSWLPMVSELLPTSVTDSPVALLLTDATDLPEPGLVALVALGLVGISVSRRRWGRHEVSADIGRF